MPAKKYIKYFSGTTLIINTTKLTNNISISKKSDKYIYFLHTNSVVKEFKHRF